MLWRPIQKQEDTTPSLDKKSVSARKHVHIVSALAKSPVHIDFFEKETSFCVEGIAVHPLYQQARLYSFQRSMGVSIWNPKI